MPLPEPESGGEQGEGEEEEKEEKEDEEEEEHEIDVSPESSLLPVFKEVTRYSEGARKVCFINFDRHPDPGLLKTVTKTGSHLKLGDEI